MAKLSRKYTRELIITTITMLALVGVQLLIPWLIKNVIAKLTDGTIVAEWLTRRGYTYAYTSPAYGFYPWDYGPFYPTYVDTYSYPDSFLRLVFGSDGVLREFKKFYR